MVLVTQSKYSIFLSGVNSVSSVALFFAAGLLF